MGIKRTIDNLLLGAVALATPVSASCLEALPDECRTTPNVGWLHYCLADDPDHGYTQPNLAVHCTDDGYKTFFDLDGNVAETRYFEGCFPGVEPGADPTDPNSYSCTPAGNVVLINTGTELDVEPFIELGGKTFVCDVQLGFGNEVTGDLRWNPNSSEIEFYDLGGNLVDTLYVDTL